MSPTFDTDLLDAGSVTVSRDAAILTVTLNDPQRRNAQTPTTWRALAHIGERLPADVAVVLLRGAGASFSAGMDRRMFTPAGVPGEASLADIVGADDAQGTAIIAGFQEAFAWWRRSHAVTISVVQGHAVGAGFQLALATDLMIVADDAELVMKESTFGLVPDLAGTHPLVAAVGYPRALEICLTARAVTAAEAVDLGLAVRRAAVQDVHGAAVELAGRISALAPGTAAATKHLLAGAGLISAEDQQRAERETQMGRLRWLVAMMGPVPGR